MQNYHPARIIFLTYQPFVLGTTAIFTYYEAKINTRLRILLGYTMFFVSSLAVITVGTPNLINTFSVTNP
jgi:equilibrative nucleoside transporter 1/2/3